SFSQFGNFVVLDTLFRRPSNRLVFIQCAVIDTQQCQSTEEWRVVQVGHMSLKDFVFVIDRRRNMLHYGGKKRLEICIISKLAICWLHGGCTSVFTGDIDTRLIMYSNYIIK